MIQNRRKLSNKPKRNLRTLPISSFAKKNVGKVPSSHFDPPSAFLSSLITHVVHVLSRNCRHKFHDFPAISQLNRIPRIPNLPGAIVDVLGLLVVLHVCLSQALHSMSESVHLHHFFLRSHLAISLLRLFLLQGQLQNL